MKTVKSQAQKCLTLLLFLLMVDSYASITWKIDLIMILPYKCLYIKLERSKDMERWLRRNHLWQIQLETFLQTSFKLNSKEKWPFKTYLNIVSIVIHTNMIILSALLITQTLLLEKRVKTVLCWQTMVKLFFSQQIQRSSILKIRTSIKNLIHLYRKLQVKLKRCSRFGLVNQMLFVCIQSMDQLIKSNTLQFGDSVKAMIKNSETSHT